MFACEGCGKMVEADRFGHAKELDGRWHDCPKKPGCPSCEVLRAEVHALKYDYQVHEQNYMAVVARVLGRQSQNNYMHPTDAAVILEGAFDKERKAKEAAEAREKALREDKTRTDLLLAGILLARLEPLAPHHVGWIAERLGYPSDDELGRMVRGRRKDGGDS